jgi:hypothetical protein
MKTNPFGNFPWENSLLCVAKKEKKRWQNLQLPNLLELDFKITSEAKFENCIFMKSEYRQ